MQKELNCMQNCEMLQQLPPTVCIFTSNFERGGYSLASPSPLKRKCNTGIREGLSKQNLYGLVDKSKPKFFHHIYNILKSYILYKILYECSSIL